MCLSANHQQIGNFDDLSANRKSASFYKYPTTQSQNSLEIFVTVNVFLCIRSFCYICKEKNMFLRTCGRFNSANHKKYWDFWSPQTCGFAIYGNLLADRPPLQAAPLFSAKCPPAALARRCRQPLPVILSSLQEENWVGINCQIFNKNFTSSLWPVLRIRIHMFLGLLDPDPSINQQI